MAFSALGSGLLGPLFATDAMRACFSNEARLGFMLAVVAAVPWADRAIHAAAPVRGRFQPEV